MLGARLYAQNRTISGTVNDNNGNPVSGASVVARLSGAGTTTNNEGRFSLNVSGSVRSLEISAVNFASQTVNVPSSGNVSVAMQATNAMKTQQNPNFQQNAGY